MNLMDEKSNVHTIDKIINLNVRKRKKSLRHPRQKKKKRLVINSACTMMVMVIYLALVMALVTVMEMKYQEVYYTNMIMV